MRRREESGERVLFKNSRGNVPGQMYADFKSAYASRGISSFLPGFSPGLSREPRERRSLCIPSSGKLFNVVFQLRTCHFLLKGLRDVAQTGGRIRLYNSLSRARSGSI